jgi:peroxiredoxin
MSNPRPSIAPGEPAPDFTLLAANREGTVSLGDYRGKSPVLLMLFRGLYCPFCRHQIARLATTADKLRAIGIESLGVVATAAERARLYFKFRQARFPLAADPELATHRAYGVPGLPMTEELHRVLDGVALAFAREHGLPATPGSAHKDMNAIDGYTPTSEDQAEFERHQAQLTGQFLVDQDGIVRWVNIEQEPAQFPNETELLETARAVSRR